MAHMMTILQEQNDANVSLMEQLNNAKLEIQVLKAEAEVYRALCRRIANEATGEVRRWAIELLDEQMP